MNNLQPSFRFAQRKDTGLILAFIKALAEYEKMARQRHCDRGTAGRMDF